MNRRLRGRLRQRKIARDGGVLAASSTDERTLQDRNQQDGARIHWDSKDIEDLRVESETGAQFPLGGWITKKNTDVEDLVDRVFAIERGEIEPGELLAEKVTVDPSELLPLHQKYNAATNLEPEQHDLSENQEIAARLFPYLPAKADLHEGKFILRTPKLKQTITRELGTDEDLARRLDVVDPNPNTARRAMEFIASFSDGMIEFVTDDGKTNYLTWSRDDWLDYEDHVEETALGGGEGGQ